MKVRITFKDGLEMLHETGPLPTGSENGVITEYVPYDFVVTRPDGKSVWVKELEHDKNVYRKLPRYHEYDRKVIL